MPLIVKETSVAANSVVGNVLSGSAFEFLDRDSAVQVGVVAAATGVICRIQFGSEVQVEDMAVPVWSGANRGPLIPDEIMVRDAGMGGGRLVVELRNTTGAAVVCRTLVQTNPV